MSKNQSESVGNEAVIAITPDTVGLIDRETVQRQLISYKYKGATLSKVWEKESAGSLVRVGGELSTLLKDDLADRGCIWINSITVEYMPTKNIGNFAMGLSASEKVPESFSKACRVQNFMRIMPNASAVGVLVSKELDFPSGVSRQLYPHSAILKPCYLTGVCSKLAEFICVVRINYDFTDADEESDFT
jgi:hypothetical protein